MTISPDFLARTLSNDGLIGGIQVVENDALQSADFALGPLATKALTASYTLVLVDVAKLITNKGAVGAASARAITLPATSVATINGAFFSLFYDFCDYAGTGMQIQANSGQQIAIGDVGNICISGGYIVNRNQYNKIRLTLLDNGVWVSDHPDPNWEVQTS